MTISVLSTNCEGYRCGTGQIADKVTHAPLDRIFCALWTGLQTAYTDSAGRFDLGNQFGGYVPKCKNISIRFSRSGYRTLVAENPVDAVLQMEK